MLLITAVCRHDACLILRVKKAKNKSKSIKRERTMERESQKALDVDGELALGHGLQVLGVEPEVDLLAQVVDGLDLLLGQTVRSSSEFTHLDNPLRLDGRRDGDDALGLEPEQECGGGVDSESLCCSVEDGDERSALGGVSEKRSQRSVGHDADVVLFVELIERLRVVDEERVVLDF